MKILKAIRYYLPLLLLLIPGMLCAQELELLGLYPVGSDYQLKARIALNGKVIRHVTTYTYRMTDGFTTSARSYDLIDNQFLSADVALQENATCTYRMEVVLAENLSADTAGDIKLLSPCIDAAGGAPFMWLGDLNWSSAVSGWGNHPPQVDKSVDTSMKIILNDTTYYKGVSNHTEGHLEYQFSTPFSRFVSRLGVQDAMANGDVRFRILTNGTLHSEYSMYSKTNPNRGNRPCYEDISIDFNDVTALRIEYQMLDGNNAADHGQLAMARLYLAESGSTNKQAQTVTFNTAGGVIPENTKRIALNATATSGGKIHYRVVKGEELARIVNENELELLHGKKGEITVEATQYGSETYGCANAMIRFEMNREPVYELVTIGTFSDNEKFAYLYLDTKNRRMDSLRVVFYDNALRLTPVREMNLMPFIADKTFDTPQVARLPWSDEEVCRFEWVYEGESETERSAYYQHASPYDYVTDITYRAGTNYGSIAVDKAYGNSGTINITGQQYAKGLGIHATAWVEVNLPEGKYNRFMAHAGKQSGRGGMIEWVLKSDGSEVTRTGRIPHTQKGDWDYPVNEAALLRLEMNDGGDGNGSDHGALGAPRLFLSGNQKTAQELIWKKEQPLIRNKPFRLTLDAKSTSGLRPVYQIVKGKAYATLENDTVLNIHTVPDKDSIVVEAFQPGNTVYAPTSVKSCVFNLTKGYVVQRNEKLVLTEDEQIEEMTVYGNALSFGQVVVRKGIVQVKKLILKYTFTPGKWQLISFPTDLNLDKVSNLKEAGYALKAYDSKMRSEDLDGNYWVTYDSPNVKGLTGYLIRIDKTADNQPKEITFTIDNVALDFESPIRILDLTLDLTNSEPFGQQDIYISPANVKGNTLKVAVSFNPQNTDELPLNYEKALRESRVTYTPNRSGIRLTLPDPTEAKIAIYDKKMKKLLKAVRYVSPMMIDIADLPEGTYNMVVSYGNAIEVKSFEK